MKQGKPRVLSIGGSPGSHVGVYRELKPTEQVKVAWHTHVGSTYAREKIKQKAVGGAIGLFHAWREHQTNVVQPRSRRESMEMQRQQRKRYKEDQQMGRNPNYGKITF